MANRVGCPGCGLEFQVSLAVKEPWVACPRCQARVVNPGALVRPLNITWTGVVGTLLLLAAPLGCLCVGPGTAFVQGFKHRPNGGQDENGLLIINTLCCLILFGAGVLLIRAGERTAQRPALILASVGAILAAVVLLVVSGLIVFYATCFGL